MDDSALAASTPPRSNGTVAASVSTQLALGGHAGRAERGRGFGRGGARSSRGGGARRGAGGGRGGGRGRAVGEGASVADTDAFQAADGVQRRARSRASAAWMPA